MPQLALNFDTCIEPIPAGSFSFDMEEKVRYVAHWKNKNLNLAAMLLQILHEFHQGIDKELNIIEQQALLIIHAVKKEMQSMDEEKNLVFQEHEAESG